MLKVKTCVKWKIEGLKCFLNLNFDMDDINYLFKGSMEVPLCISHLVGCRMGLTLGIEGWGGAGMLQWGLTLGIEGWEGAGMLQWGLTLGIEGWEGAGMLQWGLNLGIEGLDGAGMLQLEVGSVLSQYH